MIHTVKDFSIVNEAEVDVFLEFSYFFYDPVDVGVRTKLKPGQALRGRLGLRFSL